MPIIDAHLHLWDLDRLHYHWLSPEDTLLYRNVTAAEVEPLLQKCGIDGALLVEAANTSEEIGYMLELAAEHRWIKGVIGWASVNESTQGPPIWDVVKQYVARKKTVTIAPNNAVKVMGA